MLGIALLASLALAPNLDQFTLPLEEVAGGAVADFLPLGEPDGAPDLFLIKTDGSTIIAEGGFWRLSDDFSTITFAVVTRASFLKDQPTKFTTQYMDVPGKVHTIETECGRYASIAACVQAHMRALNAYEKAYPPAPLSQKPPGGEIHH